MDTSTSPSCPFASGTARKMDPGGAHGTARQWETKFMANNAEVERLTPVQQLPTNQYIATEQSPKKLKKLAGLKNNSWSPPILREELSDTRSMPGTRTGSKLKTYEKLYYNVSMRNLIEEDKQVLKETSKPYMGPKIVNVMEGCQKIPATDVSILPGRCNQSPTG